MTDCCTDVPVGAVATTAGSGCDTKLGNADGGATLERRFPALDVMLGGGSNDAEDDELLRDSVKKKITFMT